MASVSNIAISTETNNNKSHLSSTMRLSQVLCKHHKMFIGKIIKYPGSAMSGKHRFVPPATRGTRYMLWQQWRDEEEVLKYTSKAYVTADEELDYLETIGLKHQDVDPLMTSHIETPMRQRYATDILQHFETARNYEQWD